MSLEAERELRAMLISLSYREYKEKKRSNKKLASELPFTLEDLIDVLTIAAVALIDILDDINKKK